jgi:photosystem II stability/assembly factor-like uncharacterized protein
MSSVWAVGWGGKIYFFDGTTWTPQSSGVGAELHRVFAITGSEAYAVGANGTVLQTVNGGATWSTRTPPPNTGAQTLRGLWASIGAPGAHLWVVGDNGVISRSTDSGQSWMDVHDTSGVVGSNQLNDVWASADDKDVWVVGNNGLLMHSTTSGADWQRVQLGTGDQLHSIYVVPPPSNSTEKELLFVTGDNGRLFEGY